MKYLIYTLFLIIGFVLGTFWGINQLENKILERLKEREACMGYQAQFTNVREWQKARCTNF